jgi:hypothetical protein
VFALLVPSFCGKSGTSCYKVDDGNRLATSCFNKTKKWCLIVTSCYELVVINSLTTCYVQTISDLLEQLATSLLAYQYCYKMITTCSRLVNILLKSCEICTRV